jgi:CubicO group peptidase (beta-lactamase class C family)
MTSNEVDAAAASSRDRDVDVHHTLGDGRQIRGFVDDGFGAMLDTFVANFVDRREIGPTSFGHAGAGGQLAFADADARLGFAWFGNQMGGYGDARARSLTLALRRILAR